MLKKNEIDAASIISFYENFLTKSLYEVGDLWENNKISVATEHLATALVERVLNELYANILTKEKIGKKVIVGCIENEFHQVGIKMIGDIFEMNGWSTHFTGANTPNVDLINFVKEIQPDILAVSLSLIDRLPILEKLLTLLSKEFPDLLVLVGGHAFSLGGQEVLEKHQNVVFQPDLKSVDQFIKNIK